MDRIVYLGPYNNIKKDELLNKAIDYLRENRGDKFYYILPNGNLLTKYRNIMVEKVGQTFDINLFTFDDIVDKLLENKFYTYIDRETKEVLLSHILEELKEEGKLKYYGKMWDKKGFVKILSHIIGEIKRSLITPKEYLSRCPQTPFYREIGLIYEVYEESLKEYRMVDREESFFESIAFLKEDNSFFNGLDFIIIDEFFDFRPQEWELIKEISKTTIPIYINMPFNRDENFKTIVETLNTLEELGFEVQRVDKKDFSSYENMANMIFSKNYEKIKPKEDIQIIKGANSYLEIKRIAEEIKKHYVQGIELKDMGIVLANSQEYKNILFQVFEEEKIPCTLSRDINLMEIPLIKEVLYLLKLKENPRENSNIINRIKCNYIKLCEDEEREAIEYILRKTPFNTWEDIKNSQQLMTSQYSSIIDEIIHDIEEEGKLIPDIEKLEEYIIIVNYLIDKKNIKKNILNIYEKTEDYDILLRDFVALDKLNQVLNRLEALVYIMPYEISLEQFIQLLENYIEGERITWIQGNEKGVKILTPITARGQEFKVLFIVGLSQGKYPNLQDENFFFKEDNYMELKSIQLDVKNYHEKLDKESLIFTTVLASCKDNLYLSYSENATGDEKDIPSMFLDEILSIVEEEKIQWIDGDMDYLLKSNPNQLTTKEEVLKYLLHSYYNEEYQVEFIHMYNHIDGKSLREVDNRILCEIERNKDEFNLYSGNIGDKYIVEDIKNIHKDKVYSVSYLENYGKCPYLFLLNNILAIDEMERILIDFSPIDRGIITHQVLKEYYYRYNDNIKTHVLGEKEFLVENTYDYILDKIEENMKALGIQGEGKLWQLRTENNAQRILGLIKADIDRLSGYKKKILPMDFEVEFGKNRSFSIYEGDKEIYLTGKIDRIDKYVDEEKYVIIDYKNTDYNIKNIDDMLSGLSLQLPVYIMSQEDKEIVAAMYGIISKGEFQLKIGNIEEKHLVSKNHKGAVTKEELEELLNTTKRIIKEYIDLIHNGDFSVNPMECSPFCIYKDICRYEESFEVEV